MSTACATNAAIKSKISAAVATVAIGSDIKAKPGGVLLRPGLVNFILCVLDSLINVEIIEAMFYRIQNEQSKDLFARFD